MLASTNGTLLMMLRRLAKARFLGLAGRRPISMLTAIAAMVAWPSNASVAQDAGCGAPGTGDCFEPGLTPTATICVPVNHVRVAASWSAPMIHSVAMTTARGTGFVPTRLKCYATAIPTKTGPSMTNVQAPCV